MNNALEDTTTIDHAALLIAVQAVCSARQHDHDRDVQMAASRLAALIAGRASEQFVNFLQTGMMRIDMLQEPACDRVQAKVMLAIIQPWPVRPGESIRLSFAKIE